MIVQCSCGSSVSISLALSDVGQETSVTVTVVQVFLEQHISVGHSGRVKIHDGVVSMGVVSMGDTKDSTSAKEAK